MKKLILLFGFLVSMSSFAQSESLECNLKLIDRESGKLVAQVKGAMIKHSGISTTIDLKNESPTIVGIVQYFPVLKTMSVGIVTESISFRSKAIGFSRYWSNVKNKNVEISSVEADSSNGRLKLECVL